MTKRRRNQPDSLSRRDRVPRPVQTLWAVSLAFLVVSSASQARDRIVLQPPDKATPQTIPGDVADYTAERIEIHLAVGNPVHEYPADQVLSVETVHTQAHVDGVKHFRSGDLDAATMQFEQALQDDPRAWVQREILGWLVKIALRQGDRVLAGRRFLQIVARESAPREYAVVPLVWGTEPVDSSLQQHGRLWLTGSTDVERLLGASVLLLDPKYSAAAEQELDRLARVADSRIASLARTQLWRLRVTSPDVTDNELTSWEQTIDSLPPELRAGPHYLVGRASMQRSEYDRAAAAFLWLPTLYRDNEPLTAQAALGAANSLKRIGRLSEARLLLNELITDFAWSPGTAQARNLIAELESL